MTEQYTIRQAVANDLPAVMHIEYQSFEKHIIEDEHIFADRITYASGCNYLLVEERTTLVCGYFISEIWDSAKHGIDAFTLGHSVQEYHQPQGTVLYISSFALLPEVRGSGIAEHFFKTALKCITDHFSQLEQVILLVHEDWSKAIRIYEKQGFIQSKTIKHFAGFKNKQAFIYKKPL